MKYMKAQKKITDQQKDNEGTLIIERYKSLKKCTDSTQFTIKIRIKTTEEALSLTKSKYLFEQRAENIFQVKLRIRRC
jgi:uncharacterized protein YfcZ (UPF0381/DUF406 family)